MPKGRTGEAGVGLLISSKTFVSRILLCLDSPAGFSLALFAADFLSSWILFGFFEGTFLVLFCFFVFTSSNSSSLSSLSITPSRSFSESELSTYFWGFFLLLLSESPDDLLLLSPTTQVSPMLVLLGVEIFLFNVSSFTFFLCTTLATS